MPEKNKKRSARERRREHIRKDIRGTAERPRLVVFRSNKHIYTQIVDDINRRTITSASTLTKEIQPALKKDQGKIAQAKLVGKHVAQLAKQEKVSMVVFDRAGYLYHGRVKALADAARKEGLVF